jgi:hypothetical protein
LRDLEDAIIVETRLRALEARVIPLERIVQFFAASLPEPKLYRYALDRGFRFETPDVRHFCLLKAVRVVSALNAAFELARSGYTQEVAILMRTLVECTTHIEFVLDPNDSVEHRSEVERYVRAFFEDSRREPAAKIKRAQVRQGTVHASLGKTLDGIAEQYDDTEDRVPAAALYSNIYRVYSNYVHAKYPEIMDLYGGTPGRFHLHGMSGTPKDGENLGLLETFIETASNAFVLMIQVLDLRTLVNGDLILAAWYRGRFKQ